MESKDSVVSPSETKEYLTKNGVPQLFECLMTGLMYHRPADHLNYLQECLEKIKKQGISGVRWDLFLERQHSSPKPISPHKGGENLSKYDPLPGIDTLRVKIRPNTSIICVLAGPGVNKSRYSQGLINHYPTFVHLHMGDLLRNRAKLETQRKSSRWVDSHLKINAGELLPHEMVMESLIWNLNQHSDASGFIIDGFPRTDKQYEDLKSQIGLDSLACVFLIDAAEEFCKFQLKERGQQDEFWKDNTPDAIDNRICLFKLQTLPVCKCIDNDGKLRVIDGEIKPEHIARDMLTVCEFVLSGKVTGPTSRPTPGSIPDRPPDRVSHGMTGCPGQPPVFNIPRIVPQFPDKGRVADLYTCPVILLFGGPGSGRTEQAQALCGRLAGLKHFNVTDFLRQRVLYHIEEDSAKDWDVVARRVHSSDPPNKRDRIVPEYWDTQVDIIRQEFEGVANKSRAVVIEGFPNDENQLNTFNQHIGGADLAILLDCEESTLQKRLLSRYTRLGRMEDEDMVSLQRILFFKNCTLPVVRHYDERSILVTIPGDRERDLVLNDLVTVVEYFLSKQESQGNNSAVTALEHPKECVVNDALDDSSMKMVIFLRNPLIDTGRYARRIAEEFDYQYINAKELLQSHPGNELKEVRVQDVLDTEIKNNGPVSQRLILDEFPPTEDGSFGLTNDYLVKKLVLNFTEVHDESAEETNGNEDQSFDEGNLPETFEGSHIKCLTAEVHKIQPSESEEETHQKIHELVQNFSVKNNSPH